MGRNKFLGVELSGKNVGDRFWYYGRLVAEKCAGLKMRVLGFDRLSGRHV